mmetsp:Transcript_17334/g.15305  ORF Transcript_17334/g.15305 Transcript_17334/m.15305 type:complete len:185 (+) Transcript_17334:14-568(+)
MNFSNIDLIEENLSDGMLDLEVHSNNLRSVSGLESNMSHNPFHPLLKPKTDQLNNYKSLDNNLQFSRKSKTPESGNIEFTWPKKLLKTELSQKEETIYRERRNLKIKLQERDTGAKLNDDIKILLHKAIKIREDVRPESKNSDSLENFNFLDLSDCQIKMIKPKENSKNEIFISVKDIEAAFEF